MLNATDGGLIRRIALPYQQTARGTDMMASPTVADGMIFAASNKKAYYGINATTGNIIWTFKDNDADEFIICSPVYNDGTVYLIDQFFIVALNASTGQILWQTFLGAELYVSPTYADGKLYVTADERVLYVINATNGEKLAHFRTGSNSWSSPTLYEGKVYVGNHDWNVYSLSEYPALNSSVTIEVAKPKVVLGESAAVFGRLVPGIANTTITLSFVKPDSTVIDTEVATSEMGTFSFTYMPDMVGIWSVAAQWRSDRGYYDSASSEQVPVEVSAVPTPTPTKPPQNGGTIPAGFVYVAVVAIAIIVAVAIRYAYIKRAAGKSKR